MSGVRVTVTDLESGESESQEIEDDYVIVTAGSCHVRHTTAYPLEGTHVVTIKGRKRRTYPDEVADGSA